MSSGVRVVPGGWLSVDGGKRPLRRILVVQTQRLGDVVLATPVFTALRRQFPEAHLTALVHRPHDAVLRHNPDLDAVLTYDRQTTHRVPRARWQLVHQLRSGRYDWVLSIHAASSVAMALVLAGVPWRTCVWRYDRRRPPHWSRFFHQHIRQNREVPGRHEVEHNLDVLRELGITPQHDGLRVVLSEAEREEAAAILGAGGWDRSRPLVALHPGHGGGRQGWSAEAFGALADALDGGGFHVAVTGSPAEVELAQAVVANARASVRNLAGCTDLRGLIGVLERCAAFVSVSTGPMHLAAAVGTPAVTLYGPTDLRLERTRFAPYGVPHRAVESLIPCICSSSHHCREPVCMAGITPTAVLGAVEALVRKGGSGRG